METTAIYGLFIALSVLIVSIIFRRPISDLLDRTKKIDTKHFNIDTVDPPKQLNNASEQTEVIEKITDSIDDRKELDAFLAKNESPAILQEEKRIKGFLDEPNLDLEDKLRLLFRITTIATLSSDFERLYKDISGSQLQVLDSVNNYPNSYNVESFKETYESATNFYPDVYKNYSFDY